MKIGRNKGLEKVIEGAQREYDLALKTFTEAQSKIQSANAALFETVSDIDAKIEELNALKTNALNSIARHEKMDSKLNEFLSVE